MFWGLSGFSHGKLAFILWECLFTLRLIVILINKRGYPFPKSMSLIKSSSAERNIHSNLFPTVLKNPLLFFLFLVF